MFPSYTPDWDHDNYSPTSPTASDNEDEWRVLPAAIQEVSGISS
jgi:hypothetical protein